MLKLCVFCSNILIHPLLPQCHKWYEDETWIKQLSISSAIVVWVSGRVVRHVLIRPRLSRGSGSGLTTPKVHHRRPPAFFSFRDLAQGFLALLISAIFAIWSVIGWSLAALWTS